MKNAIRLLLAFLLLAALAVVFLRTTDVSPKPATPPPVPASARPVASAPAPPAVGKSPEAREAAAEIPAPPAETALLSGASALETISDLSSTYDAASVPALARYLGHGDPEIRAAARDGLINLGERAAIPFLEAAAKKAEAAEAKELLEAAEFLALPTWTERRAAERQAKAKAASPAP